MELAGPQGGHNNGWVRHNKKTTGGGEYRKFQSVKRTQWQHLAPETRGLEDEFPFGSEVTSSTCTWRYSIILQISEALVHFGNIRFQRSNSLSL